MIQLKACDGLDRRCVVQSARRGHVVVAGGGGIAGRRYRARFERRRASRCRGDDHQDRHRHTAHGVHGRRRQLCDPEPAGRSLSAEGRPARLQHLRAGRHRAAGQLEPADQRHARHRRRQRTGHRHGECDDGGIALDRDRPGRGQPARHRAAAQRPPGDRADLPGRARHVGAGRRPQHQQELPDRHHLRRRRPGQRHDLHHGRRHAQRSRSTT